MWFTATLQCLSILIPKSSIFVHWRVARITQRERERASYTHTTKRLNLTRHKMINTHRQYSQSDLSSSASVRGITYSIKNILLCWSYYLNSLFRFGKRFELLVWPSSIDTRQFLFCFYEKKSVVIIKKGIFFTVFIA